MEINSSGTIENHFHQNFDSNSNSNSTEFYTILKLSALMIPMVPVNNKKGSMEFHGTDTSSSMEFHGTWSAPISLIRAVPWNSMELGVRQFRWHEQFHGIPWNSIELRVRQFRWHEQFHGIPWNLQCANFAEMRSSMEFHGTWSAPISLKQAVPWNSMELGIRQFQWHEQFHGIPWN